MAVDPVQRILDEVRSEFAIHGSPLLDPTTGELDPIFIGHALSILSEIDEIPADSSFRKGAHAYDLQDLLATGVERAERSAHPAIDLLAGETFFDRALPLLATGREPAEHLALARKLHHAIWRRFPAGAVAYVEFVLGRLATAHSQARQEISRELHDRIGHGVLVSMQRLDLLSSSESDQTLKAALLEVRNELAETVRDVMELSSSLRHQVGQKPLMEALTDYAAHLPAGGAQVIVNDRGDSTILPAAIREELFAVVVEAIRNARVHAVSVTQVVVNLEYSGRHVTATIEDDGRTSSGALSRTGGLGVESMRERSALLNGSIEFVRRPSGGLCVKVIVPLPPQLDRLYK